MNEFKPGNAVRCIDDNGYVFVEKGTIGRISHEPHWSNPEWLVVNINLPDCEKVGMSKTDRRWQPASWKSRYDGDGSAHSNVKRIRKKQHRVTI